VATGDVTTGVGHDIVDLAGLDRWLDAHWDPAASVGEWWELLGTSGWAAPMLPADRYGRGATAAEGDAIAAHLDVRGALGPPAGAGMSIVAPTLAAHADAGQVEALLRPIVTGREAWCLLFSEPGAGTDLAALTTTATPDGDGWRVDGRKTWATGAHLADMAIVLARTGPPDSRHRGLTCFALDMRQREGVAVRPMREMTGRALSNDVELAGAWVPADRVIGGVGDGWAVVNVALTSERRTVGAHRSSPAVAGSRSGDLSQPAGEVAARPRRSRATPPPPDVVARRVAAPARAVAARLDLARLHTAVNVAKWTAARAAALDAAGRPLPGAANIAKLWAGEIARRSSAIALDALGGRGTLHAYAGAAIDDDADEAAAQATAMALAAPAVSLVGGVDLVQRDLLGERVLGLPKSPAG
jgi:alkylation response protein AidB-like acyl-CoA dehydrogenase